VVGGQLPEKTVGFLILTDHRPLTPDHFLDRSIPGKTMGLIVLQLKDLQNSIRTCEFKDLSLMPEKTLGLIMLYTKDL
jgi:hypothetical protein